jgi:hypothetical protein
VDRAAESSFSYWTVTRRLCPTTKLERVESLFPSEEQATAAEYVAEAERGASFVTVHALQSAERDRARQVLTAYGGRRVRYYGSATITDLE